MRDLKHDDELDTLLDSVAELAERAKRERQVCQTSLETLKKEFEATLDSQKRVAVQPPPPPAPAPVNYLTLMKLLESKQKQIDNIQAKMALLPPEHASRSELREIVGLLEAQHREITAFLSSR